MKLATTWLAAGAAACLWIGALIAPAAAGGPVPPGPYVIDGVPVMKIKIFNDDPNNNYIFPVLTTGKGDVDIWMQALFKVPKARETIDTYGRKKNYRIYINDLSGIPPGKSVVLTVPLYTKLVETPNPRLFDQVINWWNGGTIQIYSSPNSTPPRALVEAVKRKSQLPARPVASAIKPTCQNCKQPPSFYSDDSDLPKSDPSQLTEYTMGARVELTVKNPATDPQNTLDLRNVDFDVSYVNLAHLPATMGPFDNDQVGYVGTPLSINAMQDATRKFIADYPGWPRFVKTYDDGTKQVINKIPSPLEIFARLAPGSLVPPDLEAPPGKWPTAVWTPVQAMRNNWIKYAGRSTASGDGTPGDCKVSPTRDTFCDAIVEAKKILLLNYKNYVKVFAAKCSGKPVPLTDDLLLSHVYGWSPFIEAQKGTGTGCKPDVNLLQKTPGYPDNNYAEYVRVKLLFDRLNYDILKQSQYSFNPWVTFIHAKKYIGAPNVYAYSVDDAVGNIQAEAYGFIIDVGSTKNLENQLPAAPPITINYSIGDPLPIKMTKYRICKNDAAHERKVQPHFQSFVINAANPGNCPIFFYDNKAVPQLYTFRISQKPPFKLYPDPEKVHTSWTVDTSKPIDCSGNQGPGYQPTSKLWCCNKTAKNGAYAFSTPEPANAHKALQHFVILHAPEQQINSADIACNVGTQ